MDSRLLGRRLAAIAGGSAIIAMGAITAACAKEEKAPETTTTTTTTTKRPRRLGPVHRRHRPRRASTPRGQPVHAAGSGDPGAKCPSRTASWYQRRSLNRRLPWCRTVDEAHDGALAPAGDPRGGRARARHRYTGRVGVRQSGGDRGPLALLLASSTDLGVSRDRSAQLTVTLASQLVAFSRRSRFQNLHSVTYGCHSSESTY